jgi:hypothetical protein
VIPGFSCVALEDLVSPARITPLNGALSYDFSLHADATLMRRASGYEQ